MLKNLFLKNTDDLEKYTSKKTARFNIPKRNRIEHGTKLLNQLTSIWKADESLNAVSVVKDHGTYVEFISSPNMELKFSSLDCQRNGIKLLNVREKKIDDDITKLATIFIPKGQENYFLNKISDYISGNTKTGKPKNNDLVSSINDIKRALIKSFWTSKESDIPKETKRWCEIWISDDDSDSESSFRKMLFQNNIEVKKEVLIFPERKVLLAKIDAGDISTIIEKSNLLAELRIATEASSFFLSLPNSEQSEWVKDLLSRTKYKESLDRVLILDKGVNNGHHLIKPVLIDEDRKTYDNAWGVSDDNNHGTGMAGLVTYGDIDEKLQSTEEYIIDYSIESYKILPPNGENDRTLYGAITLEGISDFYIKNANCNRIICMAITEKTNDNDGTPSSWSAALDEITSGYVDDIKKLMIVAAGNWYKEGEEKLHYPEMNVLSSVQSPAQSWNSISVGAYTEKVNFAALGHRGCKILADSGCISPHSRTSCLWDPKWPIKPEVLFEGGNMLVDSYNNMLEAEELDLTTTYSKPQERQFTNFFGTSAACALIANMAVRLHKEYPESWPETIRGLIIHSAEWTDSMKAQFLKDNSKKSYGVLLRACGYGVPSFERAVQCKNNFVNLIIESEIQPFEKSSGSNIKAKEMNIHQIPWPKEVLEDIYDKKVKMKVTLSYFVEPGPGNVGFKSKYKYPSCNLRFDVNGNDNKNDFMKKISKAVLDEEEGNIDSSSHSSVKWILGPTNRNVGSIHSDVWIGMGAELASSNYIAVYPASGWWKERKNLNSYNKKIRYSLIISLFTEEETIDLYTPILNKINIPIEIRVKK